MFGPFRQSRATARTHEMAHQVVDALTGEVRRVLVVGDEADSVAQILRRRLPDAAVVAIRDVDAVGRWRGWADLVVSAWTLGERDRGLVARLKEITPSGAWVAVLDRGAFELIDALRREFSPWSWTVEPPLYGGAATLRFVGRAA